MQSPHPHLRVDGARLLRRIAALAEIGPIEGGGNNRLALTDADKEGRDLVVTWMRDLGLDVAIDEIGNVVGTRAGLEAGAPVMTGSHIDTVRTGGRYDGNLGVLAGLEVIEVLEAAGVTTRRPLAVAFFTNEEGSRFQPDMMGSLTYVGGLALEEALDVVGIDGATVGDELVRIGYAGTAAVPGTCPAAFVELHIEQGPVLEARGRDDRRGRGRAGHLVAGAHDRRPVEPRRHDADGDAPRRRATRPPRSSRTSAGSRPRWAAHQVGDGRTARSPSRPRQRRAGQGGAHRRPAQHRRRAARRRRSRSWPTSAERARAPRRASTITRRSLARFEPVDVRPRPVLLVEKTAKALGHSVRRMPSGAGHDAQMLARVCPAAMVFTPSRGGISHNPAEHTDPGDLEAGANVLLQVLLALAEAERLEGASP